MTHENIIINRPTHFEECGKCPLIGRVIVNINKEVAKVIEKDPNTTGATITITCIDTNYAVARVSPNVEIRFHVRNGYHERFSTEGSFICPGIIASRN